jgi:hypothetical protein
MMKDATIEAATRINIAVKPLCEITQAYHRETKEWLFQKKIPF